VAASSAALAGSAAGFLWFNRFPARVFMGDAGSLPIGGILAITALMSGTELLLLLTGAVFVVETLSVMLQVFWFRRTGRRILLCSPLHNHFVFQKVPETKIVKWFWFTAATTAILATVLVTQGLR
jgi:phospho-N-acetylmuramoyl-pentapeptide-transferase